MRYLLATDTCLVLLRRRSPLLLDRMLQHSPNEIGLSALTLAELAAAAATSRREAHGSRVALLREELAVLAFDEDAAVAYGKLRATLRDREPRVHLPVSDTRIAAQAQALRLTLITRQVDVLQGVRGLALENWASDC